VIGGRRKAVDKKENFGDNGERGRGDVKYG
jgi:hypothetical protein